MYVAPRRVSEAQQQWLNRVLGKLSVKRLDAQALELMQLWLSPQLLVMQTCGYPLMTALRGRVNVFGRPVYALPNSAHGNHCSLLIARADDPRKLLADFRGSHALVNSPDSNSGMNLFRHTLAPLQQDGRFFARVSLTGGHRASLAGIKSGQGDLAAIDSVTFDYLMRDGSEEVCAVKVIARTASSPCLPYITRIGMDGEAIRNAMNQALTDDPKLARVLAISEVVPACEEDYEVLLDYERQAQRLGLAQLTHYWERL